MRTTINRDPLAVLVRGFTAEEKANFKTFWDAERAARVSHPRKKRISAHLAILWCEWNRKVEGSADILAYQFGLAFRSECLAEWNKPTPEELETQKSRKREARRLKYNAYMRKYAKDHPRKSASPTS